MKRFLVISKGTELLRVPVSRLVYIAADGNYSTVVTQDGQKALVSYQLGEEVNLFVRLGRGLIVNTDYVYSIDISRQRIILSDCHAFRVELTASREVLIKLKAYIDATLQMNESK